jgi:hypothetical protein
MANPAGAEEHLRVIRSLMERATHYRTVSAQGALVGGLLALGAGSWMAWRDAHGLGCFHCEVTVWLIVLGITAAANLFFLWRTERETGETIPTRRARWALRAFAPSVLIAALGTILICTGRYATYVVQGPSDLYLNEPIPLYPLGMIWGACYSLGLLAASHFAPRSILFLGRAFLLATMIAAAIPRLLGDLSISFEIYMAATFGLFHLVYALLTWPRSGAAASADV